MGLPGLHSAGVCRPRCEKVTTTDRDERRGDPDGMTGQLGRMVWQRAQRGCVPPALRESDGAAYSLSGGRVQMRARAGTPGSAGSCMTLDVVPQGAAGRTSNGTKTREGGAQSLSWNAWAQGRRRGDGTGREKQGGANECSYGNEWHCHCAFEQPAR